MPGWWDTFVGNSSTSSGASSSGASSSESGSFADNLGELAVSTGISYALDKSGLTDPNIPTVGYQGGIPSYEVVLEVERIKGTLPILSMQKNPEILKVLLLLVLQKHKQGLLHNALN